MSDKLNLIETIAQEDKFSTFSRLMGSSGANTIFSGAGEFTVFAPTNDAFGKISDDKMNELLNEPGQQKLKELLSYHVLPEKVMAANIGARQVRKSVTGKEIGFTDFNGLKVNGTNVQARNIEATNGVVHALDTVLAPPAAAAATPFSTAAKTVSASPATTGPLTPITPTPLTAVPPTTTSAVPPTIPASASEKSIL